MQITRYPSLTEQQFQGCISAFADSLYGQLNAAAMYIRKLEGERKGAAFAWEMSLDTHRYGALMVLDRWAELIRAFGPHGGLDVYRSIIDSAPAKVATAEDILGRANQLIDASSSYSDAVVEACTLAFRSLETTFEEERRSAEQLAKLGPMLSQEFRAARQVFLDDLAAR